MNFHDISDRYFDLAVLGGLSLWSVGFYSFTLSEFIIKYLGLFVVLLLLILSGTYSFGECEWNYTVTIFFLFSAWLIGHSLFFELTSGGNYLYIVENGGIEGILFILESWGTWGILFVITCALYLHRTVNNITRLKWIPIIVLTVGVVGGLLPLLIAGDLFTPEKLTVLSNQYSMSALYLNAVIPLVLAEFANTPRAQVTKKTLLGMLLLAGVTSVFLTTSRGGIITLFTALGLFATATLIHRPTRKRVVTVIVSILLIAGILGGLSTQVEKNTFDRLGDTSNVAKLSGRYNQIWPEVVQITSRKPITGYSAGTYYHQSRRSNNDDDFPNAHNTWLQILHDAGIIGALLFGWVLFEIIRRAWTLFYRQFSFHYYPLGLLCSTTAIFLVHGQVESVPYGLLGFFVGLLLLCRKEAEVSPP